MVGRYVILYHLLTDGDRHVWDIVKENPDRFATYTTREDALDAAVAFQAFAEACRIREYLYFIAEVEA